MDEEKYIYGEFADPNGNGLNTERLVIGQKDAEASSIDSAQLKESAAFYKLLTSKMRLSKTLSIASSLKKSHNSRELEIATTKLEEAQMWLEKVVIKPQDSPS